MTYFFYEDNKKQQAVELQIIIVHFILFIDH